MIESDGEVVATNAVEPTVLGVFDLPATDAIIVDEIKDRCLPGKVRLVNVNGEWYLGTYGKSAKILRVHLCPRRSATLRSSRLSLPACWCSTAVL